MQFEDEILKELDEVPQKAGDFAQKALVPFLRNLPAELGPVEMGVRVLTILFGAEIMVGFAEKLWVEAGYPLEKARSVRDLFKKYVVLKSAAEKTVPDETEMESDDEIDAERFKRLVKDLLN